jgi:hypothetical protein
MEGEIKKPKKNNYDYTDGDRAKRRRARIKKSGLVERPVLMHESHTEKVRAYAKKLYEKDGYKYEID